MRFGSAIRHAAIVLLGVGLAAAPARAQAPSRPDDAPGSVARGFMVDGRTRTYHLYRPASVPRGAPVPLVLSLHGGFGSGETDERAYGWDRHADQAGFVVVYPDGIGRSWNAGACCGAASRQQIDDVGFLTHLIERLVAEQQLDRKRVFVAGMSNGAAMAYRLACEGRLPVAALGIVAGGLSTPCATPHPVSVLAIHGGADPRIPPTGGIGPKAFVKVAWPPLADVIALWRRADRCPPGALRHDGALATDQALCPDGRAVTLITIADAGHQWPGGAPPRPGLARLLELDPPSKLLDATATLWDFFRTHPLQDQAD